MESKVKGPWSMRAPPPSLGELQRVTLVTVPEALRTVRLTQPW